MTAPLCVPQPPSGAAPGCGTSATPSPSQPSRSAGRPQSGALPRPERGGETATRSNHGAHAPCRVHGVPPDGLTGPSTGAEKVHSVGAARLPQIGGLSLGLLSLKPMIASPSWSLTTKSTTLNGGSLGSWVDEDRSKLRVVV